MMSLWAALHFILKTREIRLIRENPRFRQTIDNIFTHPPQGKFKILDRCFSVCYNTLSLLIGRKT